MRVIFSLLQKFFLFYGLTKHGLAYSVFPDRYCTAVDQFRLHVIIFIMKLFSVQKGNKRSDVRESAPCDAQQRTR